MAKDKILEPDEVLETPPSDEKAADGMLRLAGNIMGRIVANVDMSNAEPSLRGRPHGIGHAVAPIDSNLPPLPEPFKGCRIITDSSEAAAWKEAVAAHNAAKEEGVV